MILTSEKGLVGEHLADHAFGLLLMLTRQLATALRLGPDAWNHRPAIRADEIELTGLTMGIFGFGRYRSCGGPPCRGLRHALHRIGPRPGSPVRRKSTQSWVRTPLTTFWADPDVLAICCPLTRETRGKFDAGAFAAMKSTAILVNVTRGEVMVEDDLVQALRSGGHPRRGPGRPPRPSPLSAESSLWELPQVVMTPHTAGASQFRSRRNLDRFVRNLERLRRGEALEGEIDKNLGY